ncbi:MAG: hypothetical protein V4509_02680 [Patescibacteria group bacterium]
METTNFDLRITKAQAEELLRLASSRKGGTYGMGFEVMCKEYGDDEEWVGMSESDLNDDGTLDDDYQTFELFFNK